MGFLDRVTSSLRDAVRSAGEVVRARNAHFQNLPRPNVTDAGPFEPSSINGGATASGVVADIAGDFDRLYVVTKTAGVWISVNGFLWQQSSGSPRWANRIALDPNDKRIIAVGGRAGESVDGHLETAGLWMSIDAGATWNYVYDPFPDTGGQQIYDLAFTQAHALLLATEVGVARRGFGLLLTFEYPVTARGGPVRALAVSETRVWARTDFSLLFSDDDGGTWVTKPLPPVVDLPGFPGSIPLYDNTAGHGNGNDRATFAAFDDVAYLIMEIADASGHVLTNQDPLLIYDAKSDTFKAQLTNDNDGRGLGGTRFVKAYSLDCPKLDPSIGQGKQLFYGGGQGIQQALSENPDRTINFDDPVESDFADNPNPFRHIHSDLWAFHISPTYCPPADAQVWVGCDGGVYRSTGGSAKLTDLKWVTHDEGLFTHNIYQLNVLQEDTTGPTRIAYGTQDNDGWWRTSPALWDSLQHTGLGDAPVCIADSGSRARVLFTRGIGKLGLGIDKKQHQASLVSLASGQSQAFTLNPDGIEVGAIQTLGGEEAGDDKLDLVMLTQLPVHDSDGNALPMDIFTPGDNTNTFALLRNASFADHPDGPESKFAGWNFIGPRLPDTPQHVWTSGGHTSTVFFVTAQDQQGTITLYKRSLGPGAGGLTWKPILTQIVRSAGTPYGPVFVSPYDSRTIFAVATDPAHPEGAVFLSLNGGATFDADEVLTALLTNSGSYKLGITDIISLAAEVGSTFHGGLMLNPSHIAFSPAISSYVAVCSPVTGVFFANTARGCLGVRPSSPGPPWQTITPFLPDPYSYISAAGFDSGQLYVATQGRGLLFVDDPAVAPPATYLDPGRPRSSSLAVLRNNVAAPVTSAQVRIQMDRLKANRTGKIPKETRTRVVDQIVQTGGDGSITTPAGLRSGTYLVQLAFPGDGTMASCEARFIYAV
jgi:hypothetical protein